ncbi:helix-turn-helix domain-containing protein, partial [Klebsiella pneumoniae]|uniref:helix-turn-helix domain-containing protein n=1 Tax=Klebsiella pneumoniae TaxID=573 RepID=UPI0040557913
MNNANTDVVLASVEEDQQKSVRDISRETDISRSSVHRLLKNEKFRPYHVSVHQALSESDLDRPCADMVMDISRSCRDPKENRRR